MKRLLVVLTTVAVVGAVLSGWWWVKSSLPILDGQVKFAGLHSPVEILIDAYGVPTAYANDEPDAWFAAGVLHARDRRWQMELYRRVTMGRLSGSTVMRISWNRLTPPAWEHPSWRQLFDVGQWDDSRVIIPAGQSGRQPLNH